MNQQIKTLKDLAAYTGFTIATVSRTLNGLGTKYRISQNTQEIIKKAAKENNFSFNENARGLRLKKTFTIGLIVPDISNPYFGKIASLIEREARKHNYTTLLCDSDNNTEVEKSSVQLLKNRKVDGIIAIPVGIEHKHLVDFYTNTPLILIDRYFQTIELPYVGCNEYQGAMNAIQHLIDLGHTKIACIKGLTGTSSDNIRLKGYQDAMEKNSLNIGTDFVMGYDFGLQNGYDQAKKLIQNHKNTGITALFSMGSEITLGILKAFKEDGISIPEDFSIVSFDEQSYSSLINPPMTTVKQPKEQMGATAIKLLFEQIESKQTKADEQASVIVPTHLVVRNSTRALLK